MSKFKITIESFIAVLSRSSFSIDTVKTVKYFEHSCAFHNNVRLINIRDIPGPDPDPVGSEPNFWIRFLPDLVSKDWIRIRPDLKEVDPYISNKYLHFQRCG